MNIRIEDGLPFVSVTVSHKGRRLTLDNVLLDTGSAGTILPVDRVLSIGLTMEPEDTIRRVRGVGGAEFVFSKRIEQLAVGSLAVEALEIEVGAMDYGFSLDGILGLDFLLRVEALIDLARLELRSAAES